jgi:hypothetical protein
MVVHIGKNDGSHINNTVKRLRLAGVSATGITFYHSEKQETDAIFCFKKWQFILYYLTFFTLVLRADLVHLWSEQVPFIVAFLKLIKKPYVIEWTGTDIRDPKQTNLMHTANEYVMGSVIRHLRNEKEFKDVMNIFSSHILINHIDHDNKVYIPHRVDWERFKFNPTIHNPLRIAHCTSNREAKGTDDIILQLIGLDVEFDLIENVSREEAIKRVSECDLVIGQMVWGEHGTQELESIAMGKPVLCYISHDKKVPVTPCTLGDIPKWINYFKEYPEQIKELAVLQFKSLEDGTEKLIDLYKHIYRV